VPRAISVTVLPEIVHTDVVADLKLTVSWELAVALTVNGGVLSDWLASTPKVIV
jgi:hypothetical protein